MLSEDEGECRDEKNELEELQIERLVKKIIQENKHMISGCFSLLSLYPQQRSCRRGKNPIFRHIKSNNSGTAKVKIVKNERDPHQ
jgi:hypothetical protein